MIEFPSDFLFGAATSAYQVEGNNVHSDWWQWEKEGNLKEPSGEACRHYQLYKQDFDLAKSLNHNCHRLSIEWSRVEPREGVFSQDEIAHYRDVIFALRERGLEPVVTLHHFTNPGWFAKSGGWGHLSAAKYYLRYVKKIVEALADVVTYWVTINEPFVYTYHAYLIGAWPPQRRSFSRTKVATDNLIAAHVQGYRFIHEFYAEKKLPPPLVSIAHNMQDFVPCTDSLTNRFFASLRSQLYNFDIIERLCGVRSLDYIGVNYYTRALVHIQGWRVRDLLVHPCKFNHSLLEKNTMGWDIYPEGLHHLLMGLKKYGLPIFILENGICVDDDARRWDFIRLHLEKMHLAMQEGAQVKGYLYWSLIDNFEWDKGFGQRFGLIGVDYHTYSRSVRESARKFAQVCKTRRLE